MLDKDIIEKLDAEFDESRVRQKSVGGREADYLESFDVIDKANEVFGYGQWGTDIVEMEIIPAGDRSVVRATVTLYVHDCKPRQDVGVNISAGPKPEALETAIKGAVSDAMKRAFRHFGAQFGNDLYDKERYNGRAAPRKAKTTKATAKIAPDAMTALWSWVNTADPAPTKADVKAALSRNDGDAEKALIELREAYE